MSLDITLLQPGMVLSEVSHYKIKEVGERTSIMEHVEGKEDVEMGNQYISQFCKSANLFTSTMKVGLQDKTWTEKQITDGIKNKTFTEGNIPYVGELKLPGIRTIFESLGDAQVFQVVFQTKDIELTNKEFNELREKQRLEGITKIQETKRKKKNVELASIEVLQHIQENPINRTVAGPMRTLNGYKTQLSSNNGMYMCVDLDLPAGDSGRDNIRLVNINTIKSIIVDGVKYVVE